MSDSRGSHLATSTSFLTAGGRQEPDLDMLVRELKDELEARSECVRDGQQGVWLRRQLMHGAIVRDHLNAAG